jgi:Holliday junction DNA helicase RuvB
MDISGIKIERMVQGREIPLDKEDRRPFSHRPQLFEDYPGQCQVKENLKVYVEAAKRRSLPLDHVILHGPPGLGKTTLAHIIANELGVAFYLSSGPSIERPGDLAGILASLEENSVLFIDEIHRLNVQVEEVLYSAMEDFSIDLVVGQKAAARSMRMPIASFTLIGATTKLSHLSRPFLSRFGIQEKLEFYDLESLMRILKKNASILGAPLSEEGALALAHGSRGTPRIAGRLLRRIWDFAEVTSCQIIGSMEVQASLARLGIDSQGLDGVDRAILKTIKDRYKGGPVGIDTLAMTLGEERSTIEDVYEPFLVYKGFLSRGPRGRFLTEKGLLWKGSNEDWSGEVTNHSVLG